MARMMMSQGPMAVAYPVQPASLMELIRYPHGHGPESALIFGLERSVVGCFCFIAIEAP